MFESAPPQSEAIMEFILQKLVLVLMLMSLQANTAPAIKNETSTIPETLLRICTCETQCRQFDKSGNVIRGQVNRQDIGKWQINWDHHSSTIKKLGLNVETEEGNTAYASYLYSTQGTKPWSWSYDPAKDQCKNDVKLPPRVVHTTS